jgi:hypothetical protein
LAGAIDKNEKPGGLTALCGTRTMVKTMTTSTWEYLTLLETDRDRLPHLGMEGWELVAIGGDPDDRLLYLKRPVQSLRERVTIEQRNRYYLSRGLDPMRSPERDSV